MAGVCYWSSGEGASRIYEKVQAQNVISLAPTMYNINTLHDIIQSQLPRERPKVVNGHAVLRHFFDAIVVRWSSIDGQEEGVWPRQTKVTQANVKHVLEMMKLRGGRDVVVVEYQAVVEEPA